MLTVQQSDVSQSAQHHPLCFPRIPRIFVSHNARQDGSPIIAPESVCKAVMLRWDTTHIHHCNYVYWSVQEIILLIVETTPV